VVRAQADNDPGVDHPAITPFSTTVPPVSVRTGRANSPGPASSTSQPRSTSRFSFDRRPSTFAFSVVSAAAAAICTARNGRPASSAASSRSR